MLQERPPLSIRQRAALRKLALITFKPDTQPSGPFEVCELPTKRLNAPAPKQTTGGMTKLQPRQTTDQRFIYRNNTQSTRDLIVGAMRKCYHNTHYVPASIVISVFNATMLELLSVNLTAVKIAINEYLDDHTVICQY